MSCVPKHILEELGVSRRKEGREIMGKRVNGLIELLTERERQRSLWGDDHDDGHTYQDWDRFIRQRLNDFYRDDKDSPEPRRRELMIHIAALALAALEADDRNGLAIRT